MKTLSRSLVIAGAALTLLAGAGSVSAQQQQQGRGNFDPEQMRARMEERMRESFDVKDDAEWKLIYARIEKVNEARRGMAGGFGGFGGFGGPGGGRPPGGGDNAGGGDGKSRTRGPGGPGGPGGFTRSEPDPAREALQKAIESKASADEIKSKLARLRESQKAKEAKLEQAQEDLKQVLSARQEAVAVIFGLLK
jgi:phage I-like protein